MLLHTSIFKGLKLLNDLHKDVRNAVRITLTASTEYPVRYTSLMVRNLPMSQACKKEHLYQLHKTKYNLLE
jgi:hypothetical protein